MSIRRCWNSLDACRFAMCAISCSRIRRRVASDDRGSPTVQPLRAPANGWFVFDTASNRVTDWSLDFDGPVLLTTQCGILPDGQCRGATEATWSDGPVP